MVITEDRCTLLSQAEELADIVMELQRRFLANLSDELNQGSVSFPQFFLLTHLEKQEVITMSAIAAKMGHTTAAATGLVDRLEKLEYVQRTHAVDDRRKVMVRITPRGSSLVAQIRQDMIDKITTMLQDHLTAEEGKMWLQIYRKISNLCDKSFKK